MTFKNVLFLILTLIVIPNQSLHAMDIAITIDDIPGNGKLPPGVTRQDIAKKMLSTLKRHHLYGVYGFLNGNALETNPEEYQILNQWVEAGQLLGNHSYSHLDLAQTNLADYLLDIKKNEHLLEKFMPNNDFHYYRYPFLAEGNTAEKRNGVRQYLKDKNYHIAQVTVDFFEYEWNDPYVLCINQNNQKALHWLKENYITQAKNALIIAQSLSTMLYDRDIKHLLLIHINAFTAEMLDELLTIYEQHGVKFISLEEALSDGAYDSNPDIIGDRSYTFLNQMRLSKKLSNPEVVQNLYDSFPEDKLSNLCSDQPKS